MVYLSEKTENLGLVKGLFENNLEGSKDEHKNFEAVVEKKDNVVRKTLDRELPRRLESQAHQLLLDAGWKIEARHRNDRTIPAYFFVNSKIGFRNKALTLAWKACGEKLLDCESDAECDENGREWWDADTFWKDMTDAMDYIDKESSLSLFQRWQILDPFMAVIWIDRKLSAITSGIGLRVLNSTTLVLGGNYQASLGKRNVAQADKNTEREHLEKKQRSIRAAKKCKCCEHSDVKCGKRYSKKFWKRWDDDDCLYEGPTGLRRGRKKSYYSAKKGYKKSKKASKVRASMIMNYSMDDEPDECLDLVCHKIETNSPESELTSDCLEQVDLLDRKAGSVQIIERKSKRLSLKAFSSRSSKKQKMAAEFVDTKNPIDSSSRCNQKHFKADNSEDGNSKDYNSDDDLLIAAIIRKKDFGSCRKKNSRKVQVSQLKASGKLKRQKKSCRLLPRAQKNRGSLSLGSRTVLNWLIEMNVISLKDAIEYRNPENNSVLKDGRVTREGIVCKCCKFTFSVSEFKRHAGLKQQRPSLNLYMKSGKSYTLCQVEAWSAEFKKRKCHLQFGGVGEKVEDDDTCELCGDGGDLICCDNCPCTYHEACLILQEIPKGDWYCPNCICLMCKGLITRKETSSSFTTLDCSQCKHKYHSACIEEEVTCKVDLRSNPWFCGEFCQGVYLDLRSRVGVINYIDDEFSWTILRCNQDDKNVRSAQKIALMAECNTKLAIALTLMQECFLPMVDPRTGLDMIPHIVYNFGSPFARLNYHGFYTIVLEKGDQLISVASIRVHGANVAEVPLIATCSYHRRQGMCRRLLNKIEELLISLKVKMLVLSAIPSLVETWTSCFGFQPIRDEEKQHLSNFTFAMFPGTILLKKNLLESLSETVENIESFSKEQQAHISGNLKESNMESCLTISTSDINEVYQPAKTEVSSSPIYNITIRELKEGTPQNSDILSKDISVGAVNFERTVIPLEGDEAAN